jgi:hypothetical protein
MPDSLQGAPARINLDQHAWLDPRNEGDGDGAADPGIFHPALVLLILLITNNRGIVGDKVNGVAINVLGWITTAVIFAASAGLIASWFI